MVEHHDPSPQLIGPRRDDAPGVGPEVYAARALMAYVAMQRSFRRSDGGYRRDGRLHRRGSAAHLWPFARALIATLDLAGIREDLGARFEADAAIVGHLEALERYWDPGGEAPAYSSDIVRTRLGGDRYYDDNAWVGLALVQLERMRPGAGQLDRAAELFRFAVDGWDRRLDVPSPGGVFWVEQGRGAGARNHDRNTVSNAPNAELGLHLAELTGASVPTPGSIGAEEMCEWVDATLYSGSDGEPPTAGLFWDKLRGDGTVDETLWSYNQGSMIGANVLLHRRTEGARSGHLARAEAIARSALRYYAGRGYESQPPAFNAIFFRNLLLLHSATADAALGGEILETMRAYVDRMWARRGDREGRIHNGNGGVTLLHQSAIVQLLALLAWAPDEYRRLA